MQSNTTTASTNKSSTHGRFHQCNCYGHENTLPDYKHDISIPHTLQGYYALHGGCPCPPPHPSCNNNAYSSTTVADTGDEASWNDKRKAHENSNLQCTLHFQGTHQENNETSNNNNKNNAKCNAYREAAGKHTVYKADDTQLQSYADKCKCNNRNSKGQTAGQMTRSFPNARNYGGTSARSGVMMFSNNQTTEKKQREAKMQKLQDRIDFLRSLLHDEMCDRIQAEQLRTEIEMELKLLGSYHAQELRTENTKNDSTQYSKMNSGKDTSTLYANDNTVTPSMLSVSKYAIPTVAQSHANIMDELEYVSNEPLGSKENIIRLYYLLQEEEQNAKLRRGNGK